jgi:hypothetical protein
LQIDEGRRAVYEAVFGDSPGQPGNYGPWLEPPGARASGAYLPMMVATCSDHAAYRNAAPMGSGARNVARDAQSASQAAVIRDLFGNPFRPITLDPDWLAPTVRSLARAAYDERILPSGELDPRRLAVLADALEEAGCADEQVLSHLRGPGPPVRGALRSIFSSGRAERSRFLGL